ncbi:MAG: hypothetical protein ABIQ89_04390 [Candidatus Saccharimonadales bacterium]
MQTSSKFYKSIKSVSLQTTALVLALSSVLFALTGTASAAQITTRKLTVGSSVPSAVTTYTLNFALPSATVLQSFQAQICTTPSGACTTPSGFVNSASTLPSQPTTLGDASGWTVNTSTAGSLRLKKTGNAAARGGTSTVVFGNVTNPSAANSTFYARMTSFSDDAWTTAVDTGTTAASTAGQITVTAAVDENLSFTLAAATVALGTLTSGTTGSGTSTMSASTNAANGYAITVAGGTLTSGANTIAALAANTASTQGTAQFGINLMANTTPSVGTAVSGAGTGAPATNYNTANSFRFGTGETVASAAAASNSNTYTVSYIANIPGNQAAGAYSTALTYIATATF